MKVWLRKEKMVERYNNSKGVFYVKETEFTEGDLEIGVDKRVYSKDPTNNTVLACVSKALFSKLCTRGDIHIQDPQVRTKQ